MTTKFSYTSLISPLRCDHQVCLYHIFNVGSNFECECRPTTGAKVFHEVDMNDDEMITLDKEMLAFYDNNVCFLSSTLFRTVP
jgi:hypothetical protein